MEITNYVKIFKKILLFSLIELLIIASVYAQKKKQYHVACIAFYNLENLFDTIDNKGVRDTEFTPQGKDHWTSSRYENKLNNLSEVISRIGTELTSDGPAVIGVSEVENRQVLEDLVKTPKLKPLNYHIVHYDSPDRRGIDVALLYQPKYFKVISSRPIPLKIKQMPYFRTRDQLLVSGILDKDSIYFIVNHWPSRRGGEKRSRPLRNAAADRVRLTVDSLLKINKDAKIIVMGDLNDDPVNQSVKLHLRAKGSINKLSKGDLFDPMTKLYKNGIGSLAWRDSWNLFDQIILTQSLLGNNKSSYKYFTAKVFNKRFITKNSGPYKGYPLRTYVGSIYQGGYSDHYPVYIFLIKEENQM